MTGQDNTKERGDAWPRESPEVGQRAELSRTVSEADIERFSAISGDHNPIHYSEQAARNSPFGELVVQGGITSAVLNAVVAEELPGPGTVFMSVDWDFEAPVRPGDTITAVVKITDVRHDKPVTELDTRVVRDDDTVALTGTAVCYTVDLGNYDA